MSGVRAAVGLALLLLVVPACTSPGGGTGEPQGEAQGETRRSAEPSATTAEPTPSPAASGTLTSGPGEGGASAAAEEGPAYAFPVRRAAAVDYGRAHHDYPATDVFATCGSAFVAPAAGVVQELSRVDPWDAETDRGSQRGGRFVSLVTDEGWRFYGSHLQAVAPGLTPGDRVEPGQALGRVGRSGNAAATPCHVHVGLSPDCGPGDWRVRRGVLAPWPYLDAWRTGGQRSPQKRVAAWHARHGCG